MGINESVQEFFIARINIEKHNLDAYQQFLSLQTVFFNNKMEDTLQYTNALIRQIYLENDHFTRSRIQFERN